MQTTEELKRAMYKAIAQCKIGTFVPPQVAELEEALEAYLEALRKERQELMENHPSSYRLHDQMRERIRLLLEANRAAGEVLREIVSERDSLLAATSHQAKRENDQEVPAAKPQGHLAMFNWLIRICRGLK